MAQSACKSAFVLKRRSDMLDSDSDQVSTSGDSSPQDGIGHSVIAPNFGVVQHNPSKRIPLMGTWRLHESRGRQRLERSSVGEESDAELVFHSIGDFHLEAKQSTVRRLSDRGCGVESSVSECSKHQFAAQSNNTSPLSNTHQFSNFEQSLCNDAAVIKKKLEHLEYHADFRQNGTSAFHPTGALSVTRWLQNNYCNSDINTTNKNLLSDQCHTAIDNQPLPDNANKAEICVNGTASFDSEANPSIVLERWKFDENFNAGAASLLYSCGSQPLASLCQRKRLNFMKLCLRRNQPFYFLEMAGQDGKVPSRY
ncbi:uncharacterized protein [Diadema antillarum]|uniref:uncharacterized protein n=1 Tax=Diadema antillarum TaxID=105358 RepID=UPI003A89026A